MLSHPYGATHTHTWGETLGAVSCAPSGLAADVGRLRPPAVETDLAGKGDLRRPAVALGPLPAGEEVEQRRFAASRRPHDAGEAPWLDGPTDALEDIPLPDPETHTAPIHPQSADTRLHVIALEGGESAT